MYNKLDVLKNLKNWDQPQKNKNGLWEISFQIEFKKQIKYSNTLNVGMLEQFLSSGMQLVQHRFLLQPKLDNDREDSLKVVASLRVNAELESKSIQVRIISLEHPIDYHFFQCYDWCFKALEQFFGPIEKIQGQDPAIWMDSVWP